jgi:hypothetical protein
MFAALLPTMARFAGRWRWWLLLLFVAGSIALRLWLATLTRHPGHSDFSFYYTVARNLAEGRGAVVEYAWHYLLIPAEGVPPEPLPRPAFDYWMPLTSLIISLAMLLAGSSLFVALLPSIICGAGVALLAFLLGNHYARSEFVAAGAAVLALCVPTLFTTSLLTDTTIYYALFAGLSLFFIVKGRMERPLFFLAASGCAALAHLTRQDGILLLIFLVVAILLTPLAPRERGGWLLGVVGVYGLLLAPLLLYNLHTFGSLLPAGSARTAFLTNYEDTYSYAKEFSLHTYLQWGFGNILGSKLSAVFQSFISLREYLGVALWPAALLGFYDIIRSREQRRRTTAAVHMGFLVLLFAFHTLVVTFPGVGGFARSGAALIPFLLVVAVDTIHHHLVVRRGARGAALLLVALLAAFSLVQGIGAARAHIAEHNHMADELAAIHETIRQDVRQREQEESEVVVMTRIPWELHLSTGYRAIQVPNNDRDTIYAVGRAFGATHLLLPALREELRPIYTGEDSDKRWQLVGEAEGTFWRVFRFTTSDER